MEVHPPTATGGATIIVDDDVYQALEERAAGSGRTAQELVEAGLGAAMLLGELDTPPEDPGNAT